MHPTTSPPVPAHTPGDLAAFAVAHRMRDDWHEPDEQGVAAHVVGTRLDNAFGPDPTSANTGELRVVLTGPHGSVVANLADVLAWAASSLHEGNPR